MVKWISVKIVVDGKDGSLCDSGCPHFDQRAGPLVVERCGIYHRALSRRPGVVGRRRCDECLGAKEL